MTCTRSDHGAKLEGYVTLPSCHAAVSENMTAQFTRQGNFPDGESEEQEGLREESRRKTEPEAATDRKCFDSHCSAFCVNLEQPPIPYHKPPSPHKAP